MQLLQAAAGHPLGSAWFWVFIALLVIGVALALRYTWYSPRRRP